ncbi:CheW-like protein domain protein [Candidatus Magnetoovum chiemensis]|nr:CheW-like protein domain protein [Candidatus Magnetoovum chiemensis]
MTETNGQECDISQDRESESILIFGIGDFEFGVYLNSVRKITPIPKITRLPRSPEYLAGICNLWGGILPVIDTQLRLLGSQVKKKNLTPPAKWCTSSLPADGVSEYLQTYRLLVIKHENSFCALIIDDIRDIVKMTGYLIEPTPDILKGINKDFLDGVFKVYDGKRFILLLNLDALMNDDFVKQEPNIDLDKQIQNTPPNKDTDKENLLSFYVEDEEYAFRLDKVEEILKISEITTIPNAPEYIRGLYIIHNQLLPLVDLRTLFGKTNTAEEIHCLIDDFIEELILLDKDLKSFIENRTPLSGLIKYREASFIKWLRKFKTNNSELNSILNKLKHDHSVLYSSAQKAVRKRQNSLEQAIMLYTEEVNPLVEILIGGFNILKDCIENADLFNSHYVLVIRTENINIGYIIDNIKTIESVPKHSITSAADKRDIQAVARLENGKRLIMILNEKTLISQKDNEMLSSMTASVSSSDEDEKNTTLKNTPLVYQKEAEFLNILSFTVNKQEYGIALSDVREINSADELSPMQSAPFFIDGLLDINDKSIPVISLRSFFRLEPIDKQDKTRIILADISNNIVGIKVDKINSVVTIDKKEIKSTPSMFTFGSERPFMEGVFRTKNGASIIILLDIHKLLDEEELASLIELCSEVNPVEPINRGLIAEEDEEIDFSPQIDEPLDLELEPQELREGVELEIDE